ncbi:MAG: SGNH/GDSL hydrolase family protein [Myxococcota bacterium]
MSFARNVAGGIALNVILALLFCLVLTEVLLRVPTLFGTDPSMPERDPNRRHVLCIGDSFTVGGAVDADDRYPAQLQRLLERSEPGAWATVNLGFTGETSSYIGERLSADLRRYQPEVVVLWAGGNMDTRMLGPRQGRLRFGRLLEQLLGRLELYRFVRVWLDDRALERRGRELEPQPTAQDPAESRQRLSQRFAQAEARERAFQVTTTEAERRSLLEQDYRSIIEQVRDAGGRLIFITYPVDLRNHGRANAVMRRLGSEYGIPVVSSWEAAQRVPPDERHWHWGMHHSQPIYAELVRSLAPVVLDRSDPASGGGKCHKAHRNRARWAPRGTPRQRPRGPPLCSK